MVAFVILLCVVIYMVSRLQIHRYEPVGLLIAMWLFLILTTMAFSYYIKLAFSGIMFILLCLVCCSAGAYMAFYKYNPARMPVRLMVRLGRMKAVLLVLFGLSLASAVYSFTREGFGLQVLLNFNDMLEMNNDIAMERYYGDQSKSMAEQIFNALSLPAPMMGGFAYRLMRGAYKKLCILTIFPGIVVALTQAVKMSLITSVLLWVTGLLVASFSYRLSMRIRNKTIIISIISFFFVFVILLLSMMFRSGQFDLSQSGMYLMKFANYFIGSVPCFDLWFANTNETEMYLGLKTFMGISNFMGLVERVQGLYSEMLFYGQNGFDGGMSNVYSAFRVLTEDFGFVLTFPIMSVFGFFTYVIWKNVKVNKHIMVNQTLLVGIYAYVFWSFVTSFYVYTSYILLIILVYFILCFTQKVEYARCELSSDLK